MTLHSLSELFVHNTNPDNYITAIAALNIPSDKGTGDWHFFENFMIHDDVIPTQKVAGIDTLSTKKWLGNTGIFDCYEVLKECGLKSDKQKIYAANHYRAIADMVYDNVKRGYSIKDTISLNDWLPELHEKKKMYILISLLESAMTSNEWDVIKEWIEVTKKPQ
ncbi:MAG: hypothetical protein GQ532_08040 [Methylomarinum sp.]|nr:hypothetical protein [Methylomarinum sp.]